MYQLIINGLRRENEEIRGRITKENDYAKCLQAVQITCAWRSDSTTIFQTFANGIKVTSRITASEIYSELFTYFMLIIIIIIIIIIIMMMMMMMMMKCNSESNSKSNSNSNSNPNSSIRYSRSYRKPCVYWYNERRISF